MQDDGVPILGPVPRPLWRRALWLGAGSLALAAGVVGIFLPLLPTTPLVILAAFCFSRGCLVRDAGVDSLDPGRQLRGGRGLDVAAAVAAARARARGLSAPPGDASHARRAGRGPAVGRR
ncbi:MAG: YbaN family protein [Burkholderiaceae bacterium]|nr:YbaN family protein [Burkholderiaceae bacterium]